MTKGKVLVVDDDRLVLATVAHGLVQAGYQVIDADNGDDAILLARQYKPDLALLDIRMEGKTGFDVAEYLREYCCTPFIFLSAFADDATLKQVNALGALAYLTKPLNIQRIIPEVDAAFSTLAKRTTPPEVPPSNTIHADFVEIQEHSKTNANLASQSTTVLLAIGIVMHRHSLSKEQSLARLQAQALNSNDALQMVCQRIVDAQEVLAGLGSL